MIRIFIMFFMTITLMMGIIEFYETLQFIHLSKGNEGLFLTNHHLLSAVGFGGTFFASKLMGMETKEKKVKERGGKI